MIDGDAPSFGNPDAKIRMVEFLDYQCPFSKKTAPAVRAFMAKHTDDAFFIIRDYPITSVHDMATDAAISAQCVFAKDGADKYWSYQDFLFQNQGKLTAGNMREAAIAVGVDATSLDACVIDQDTKSNIEKDTADALSVGVNGTPTFFMNGYRIPGAATLEQLEMIYAEIMKRL
jgi:protein-disulfide isomerase